MTIEDPREADDLVIRADGTLGIRIRAHEYSAAWSENLLEPDQTMQAVREILGS